MKVNTKHRIGILIKTLNNMFDQELNKEVEAFDLSSAQALVLGHLMDNRGLQLYHKDIEVEFNLSHPTVSGIVKRLEAKGFVECSYDEDDRRCKRVVPTEKSVAVQEKMKKHIVSVSARALAGMTQEELSALEELLGRMLSNMDRS